MAMSKDEFRKAAQATYANLVPAFAAESQGYFWRLGHSFDTIVDYFVNVDASDAGTFATLAIDRYNGGGGAWWDDYGWWAISALKAAASGVFGDKGVVFRTISLECFDKMYNNAPYGWARADQRAFAQYAPLFAGGVWNHVVDGGCNPGGGNGLCGRQNTVTNGLYLVASSRLSCDPEVPPYPAYRQASDSEYGFLDQWFNVDLGRSLLHEYAAGRAFVRERVGYFDSSAVDVGYRPDLAWAGDQGLIVGGLAARMLFASPDEYQTLLAIARRLLAGTPDYLVDPMGFLKPWYPEPAPGNDNDDYWTGPAVFMRYLLSAYQNEDLRANILALDYQQFIYTNAKNVVTNPDRPQSGDPVVNLTNNLAFLVAAIAML
jgi:hypothetical protein